MASGPQARVAAALARLTIVCHKPKRISTDEAEALWFDTMTQAMMDYPLDVVQWAFEAWRKTPDGEWWPAEAEIRRLCEKSVEDRRTMRAEAERALRDMEYRAASTPQPRRYEGRAAEFMERARARCTRGQILSYFSKYGMRIQGDTVWVKSPICETMVKRIAGDIADELNFTIKRCRTIPCSFPDYDGPPPTEEEKAEFRRRMNALAHELKFAPPPRPPSQSERNRSTRTMAQQVIADHEAEGGDE